jgi:hypothetical protein
VQGAAQFYTMQLRGVAPRDAAERAALEAAEGALRREYREYRALVTELNALKPAGRPCDPRDVAARAREVARAAELEFLIDMLLTPRAQGAKASAA